MAVVLQLMQQRPATRPAAFDSAAGRLSQVRPSQLRCTSRSQRERRCATTTVVNAAQQKDATVGLSAKQQRVEADAWNHFERYCSQQSVQTAGVAALALLREALSTRKTQPQLALGAVMQLERDADVGQGA